MAIKSFGFASAGGGAGTGNLDDVTSRGATTTNAITVGGVTVGTEYSLPTLDGSANQVLQTNGTGTVSFATLDFTGGLEYKGTFNATAGTPSLANAEQGDYYKIDTEGTIYGKTWAVNDSLLINADMGGTITNSKIDKLDNTDTPASETVAGVIEIATNAEATAGTATDKALVPSNISNIALSSFNDDLSYLSSGDNVSLLTNDANYVASGDNVSTLTNDAGYLTGITGEGLNDLSDVSFTAGLAIDGHVLTYDNTAGEWQAVAPASGGLSSVVQDTTPQLGGALDVNGQEITSASNGNVVINPDGTGDITIGADVVPDADATHTIGSEDNRYITTFSDLNGAIRFKAKNDEGAQITKGQAVYIKGLAGDGTTPTVGLADADDSTKMPAFGLAFNTANNSAEIQIVQVGNLGGLDTSGFSVGDTLYIDTTAGAVTKTKPTGESSQLQNIGRVIRSDNGDGVIMVGGAGRSAATPNLDQDKIFLGNASNQSVSTALSAIGLSKFDNDSGFLTDITSESLNDLSDVSFTAGAGIDGNVLTYDNTAGEWQAVAPASGGGSDFTAVTADVARTNFAVTNYYTVLEESTQHSIYLPNYFEGDALGDFQNKRITVDNQGETTVRVLLRTSGTSANRLYASYEDFGSLNFNENTVVISSITYAYIDIPAFTTYKLACREHATVSYWFVEPFIMQFDNFSPANRDILVYNSTTEKYENSSDRSELIYSFQNSNFTAEVGYYYYVDSTAGDITVSLSTDATVVGKRFKIFKAKSANSVIITESNAINTIDPDDGAAGATSRSIQARSMIEFIAYSTSADYTYIITPQVEINDSDLNASGEFLIYDASVGAKQLITAPYTMPTADGSANQIISTDGAGSLSFIDQPSGSAPDVVTDSSGTNTTISTTTGTEEVHLISNGANNVAITIPAASTAGEGYKYQVKRLGTGTVSVAPSSGTIDGAASFSLASQYDSVTVVSDNSNWFII